LDEAQSFANTWLILTDRNLVIATGASPMPGRPWHLACIPLVEADALRIEEGLSTCRLQIVANASLRAEPFYARRLGRADALTAFAARQERDRLRGLRAAPSRGAPEDPGRDYRDAVPQTVQEQRALLTRGRASVLWRLIGYLKPHRRAMAIGMA